jgi:hypothetical protein
MELDTKDILVIAEYEGFEIEEARLTYAQRQDLSPTVFCGPNKTYPAHDARHVRAGFQRLSQFGKNMPKAVALKIYRCLLRRASKYNIEHDSSSFRWLIGEQSVEETFKALDDETNEVISFLLERYGLNVN